MESFEIKNLKINELEDKAQEIRNFLIEKVSKTGGHLSSNLGVVELTMAIHYCFDLESDKLFFDVGHQSYTHKILTGRGNRFDTLRKYNGLSGFQKLSESPYDHFESGHAGNAISAAIGNSIANKLDNNNYQSIAFIGDACIANGEAFEAINHLASLDNKVIIILNDNHMSISSGVGAFDTILSKLRSAKGYRGIKGGVKNILGDSEIGKKTQNTIHNIKDAFKQNLVKRNYFDDLGLDYYGPVDGHNFSDLITILNNAKEQDHSVIIHVKTIKGKGYSYAQKDRIGVWHGVSGFDILSGEILKKDNTLVSYSKIVADKLEKIALTNENVVALTPAMIQGSALESFFAKFPERSFDCGIAEAHAMTLAAGLALAGKRPFISIYSTFLQRAYDQINQDICRMNLPVVIGVDRAGIVGEDGDTHHGIFDISILRSLPNLIICQGKDYKETLDLLETGFNQNNPYVIRYPRASVNYDNNYKTKEIKVGSWLKYDIINPQVVIISYGPQVDLLLEKVRTNKFNYLVVNARFIKPLDEDMLKEVATLAIPIYVYESDVAAGGLASAILEFYSSCDISVNLKIIGIGDNYIGHGSIVELRKQEKIDINSVISKINSEI